MTVDRGSYDQSAMHMAALVVLLDRIGGSITFTEAEYQAVVARHGGNPGQSVGYKPDRA